MTKAILNGIYQIFPLLLLSLLLFQFIGMIAAALTLDDVDASANNRDTARVLCRHTKLKYYLFHATPHDALMRLQREREWDRKWNADHEKMHEGSASYVLCCTLNSDARLLRQKTWLYLLPRDCRKPKEDAEDE